jgi:hypothetical protein
MERLRTISPEALPYWNMIKDASPEVKNELGYYLINIPVSMGKDNETISSSHKVDETDPQTEAFLAKFAGKWPFEGVTAAELTSICESNRKYPGHTP